MWMAVQMTDDLLFFLSDSNLNILYFDHHRSGESIYAYYVSVHLNATQDLSPVLSSVLVV